MSLFDSVRLISLCGQIRSTHTYSNPKPYGTHIEMIDGVYIKADGRVFHDTDAHIGIINYYNKYKDSLEADAKSHVMSPFMYWFAGLLDRIARRFHVAYVFADHCVSMIPSIALPRIANRIDNYMFVTSNTAQLKAPSHSGDYSVDLCEVGHGSPEKKLKKFEDRLTYYLDHNETVAYMKAESEFINLANEYIKLLSERVPGGIKYSVTLPNSTDRTETVEALKSKIKALREDSASSKNFSSSSN